MDRVAGFGRAGICRPCSLLSSTPGSVSTSNNLCGACQRITVPAICLRGVPYIATRRAKRATGGARRVKLVPRAAAPSISVNSDPCSQSQVTVTDSDEGKRKPIVRNGRFRSFPGRKIRSRGKPIKGSDIELQKVAEALESAYRKDSSISRDDKSDYAKILKDLELQIRSRDDKSDYVKIIKDLESQTRSLGESGSSGASSSSSVIPIIRKRRGRPPSAATLERRQQSKPGYQESDSSSGGSKAEGGATQSRRTPVEATRAAGEGKIRLNLGSRIALRKRRLEASKLIEGGTGLRNASLDIWSAEADKLIANHGMSLDLGVVDWDNLKKVLLSADEEAELARSMIPAKAFEKTRLSLADELGRDPSDEEWAAAAQVDVYTLRRHLLLGKAARNKLIQRNLRLVLFQAHKYHRDSSSLSLYDLCQEGVSGLIHGVDKFDPKRGHRFSTYAIYWVRNSILRALTRSGSSVRSPYNVALHKLNIKRARLDLLVELERAPTDEEVMDRLGLTPDRFRDILRSSARMASMNKPSAVTGEELIHTIEDNSTGKSARGMPYYGDDSSLRFGVSDVLDSLKPKEGLVLRQRFGLDGQGEKTLGEIGQTLGLSREMVRKYEMCALMKMKHPTRMEYLRSYLS